MACVISILIQTEKNFSPQKLKPKTKGKSSCINSKAWCAQTMIEFYISLISNNYNFTYEET